MNYLMLSVGRRGELMKDFRISMEEGSRIIATDNSSYAPALYFADKQYIVPRIDAPEYMDVILDICKKEQINAVKDFPDYYGGMYVQNGNDVVLLVEDTSENRAEICRLLGITESLTTFRTVKYSHNYLTLLQDKISKAMQNKEFKSVIGSGLMDAQNHILVTMTKEDKEDIKKLEKMDTEGGAIAIEVSSENSLAVEE